MPNKNNPKRQQELERQAKLKEQREREKHVEDSTKLNDVSSDAQLMIGHTVHMQLIEKSEALSDESYIELGKLFLRIHNENIFQEISDKTLREILDKNTSKQSNETNNDVLEIAKDYAQTTSQFPNGFLKSTYPSTKDFLSAEINNNSFYPGTFFNDGSKELLEKMNNEFKAKLAPYFGTSDAVCFRRLFLVASCLQSHGYDESISQFESSMMGTNKFDQNIYNANLAKSIKATLSKIRNDNNSLNLAPPNNAAKLII